jgi:hypothetical protein
MRRALQGAGCKDGTGISHVPLKGCKGAWGATVRNRRPSLPDRSSPCLVWILLIRSVWASSSSAQGDCS